MQMKKFTFLCIAVFLCLFVSGQTDSLLRWQVQSKKLGNGLYELVAKTTVPAGWHLYGINTAEEGLESPKFIPDYEKALLPDPAVFDKDPARGFVLLEDLGDQTLLHRLKSVADRDVDGDLIAARIRSQIKRREACRIVTNGA